jgi:hypothetical protein
MTWLATFNPAFFYLILHYEKYQPKYEPEKHYQKIINKIVGYIGISYVAIFILLYTSLLKYGLLQIIFVIILPITLMFVLAATTAKNDIRSIRMRGQRVWLILKLQKYSRPQTILWIYRIVALLLLVIAGYIIQK